MSYNAVKLQGVFSISGQEEVDNTYDSTNLTYAISQKLRPISTDISVNSGDSLPEYYITLSGDINAFFDVSLIGISGQDDAWSCSNFTSNGVLDISSGTSTITLTDGTTSKNFTVGWVNTNETSANLVIGQIDISTNDGDIVNSGITIDGANVTQKTYNYTLTTDIDSEGKLSFTTGAYVSASNSSSTEITISTTQDETLYQQQMYMNTIFVGSDASFNGTGTTTTDADPLVNVNDYSATGADVKSFTYDFADHNTALSSALTSSLSGISGETLVSKLNINVSAVDISNTNGISKWANEQGREGNTDTSTGGLDTNNRLFKENEAVWIYNSGNGINNSATATLDMRQYNSDGSTYTEVLSRSFGVKLIQSSDNARP